MAKSLISVINISNIMNTDKPRKLWKLEQEISDHREERTNYYGKQSKERLVVSTGPRRKFALTISSSLPRVVRLLVLPRET